MGIGYLSTYNIAERWSSVQLGKDFGISQKAAWYLAHRIREGWREYGSVTQNLNQLAG